MSGMCIICDGGTWDDVWRGIDLRVRVSGYAPQHVEAAPGGWEWSYTVGLLPTWGLPELSVVGIPPAAAEELFSAVIEEATERGSYLIAGEAVPFRRRDEEHAVRLADVHQAQYDHGIFGMWGFYYDRSERPEHWRALQLLLPDLLVDGWRGKPPRLDGPSDVLGS
jgi:hypothetical protein